MNKNIEVKMKAQLFWVLLFISSPIASNDLPPTLRHAETYYWLGIQDKGDPGAFQMALQYLDQAQNRLESEINSLDSVEFTSLQQQIIVLRSDLDEQLKIAQNTFIGRYPLARFMGKAPFVSSKAFGSFEVFEQAGEVAAARAASKLGGLFYEHFFGDLQLPLIVVSEHNAFPDMESKVRVIIKNSSRVKVYQTQYLKKYLSENQLESLQNQQPDIGLIEKICQKLNVENFAITRIRKTDHLNDVYFYSFYTLVFSKKSDTPSQAIVLYELVRDKRKNTTYYFLLIAFLLFSSVVFYVIYYKKSIGNLPGIKNILTGPVMAFLVGMLTTLIALGVLYNLMPDYLDFYGYTFWWVPAAFAVVFIAPLFIIKNYILNLSYYKKEEVSSSRLSPYFVSSSMGVAAYLSLGLLLYHKSSGYFYVITMAFSFAITAHILGKTLGSLNPLPPLFALSAVLLIPFTGLFIASAQASNLIFPVLFFTVLLFFSLRHSNEKKNLKQAQTTKKQSFKRVDLAYLIEITENPPYHKTPLYHSIRKNTEGFLSEKSSIVCLTGKEGSGKTAMARQIISDLHLQISSSGGELLFLDAQCQETSDTPYQPVQQALAEVINFMRADDFDNNLAEIDNAIEKLVGGFIPFGSLLKSGAKSKSGAINSQSELFFYISKSLKELSRKYYLILFIDDLHWADNATIDLLNYLHNTLSEKDDARILFIYTSRPTEANNILFHNSNLYEIYSLPYTERLELLTADMGIERDSAEFILQWIGNQENKKGGMFWMFKVIEKLARNGHLNEGSRGIELSGEIMSSKKIPIPDEFASALREELNKLDNYEEYIAVAACQGMEFEVSILSASLGVDRLKCLKTLKFLEKETSIIYDIPEKDDVFGFTSSFALETIREILALTDEGPKGIVKQIVREYHARIALSIEKVKPENNSLRIASHYYAAGSNYANSAMRFLIMSADYCAEIFRFNEARNFLHKAEIEKTFANDSIAYEIEILLVECKISMLEGKNFETTADKCESYLKNHPDTEPFAKLIFARTYYYARWFNKSEELCRDILTQDLDKLVLTRVYHMLAISLDPKLSDERMKYLRLALETIPDIHEPDTEHRKAMGEIHNSFGEEYTKLSQKSSKNKELANSHFNESIRIKSLKDINDTPGIARAYGGLGRLELYIEPVDVNKALEYFEKDLLLSQQIGDILGQTQMHSNMGKCYLLTGEFEKALPAYQKSFELAERTTDKAFALLGQLQVFDQTDWGEVTKESLTQLKIILEQEIDSLPDFLKTELIAFFKNANKKKYFKPLLNLLYTPAN